MARRTERRVGGKRRRNLQSPTVWLGWMLFRKTLTDRGPNLNIARLMTSRHLADLQWIASVAALPVLLACGIAIVSLSVLSVLTIAFEIQSWFGVQTQDLMLVCDDFFVLLWRGFHWFKSNSAILTTLLGALLAIFNWSYQAANRRLGTIDLFAAEIGTICRMWLVLDFARATVASALAEQKPMRSVRIGDDDKYTPVHEGQLAELVAFDVGVVTSITEFYTYRTAMLDCLRSRSAEASIDETRYLTAQMLYMFYLSLESARVAIGKIVEFEPNEAESIINILCSEIPVFAFLLTAFPEQDYRGQRLRLRFRQYEPVIHRLKQQVAGDHLHWTKAQTTLPELEGRYRAFCEQFADAPPMSAP